MQDSRLWTTRFQVRKPWIFNKGRTFIQWSVLLAGGVFQRESKWSQPQPLSPKVCLLALIFLDLITDMLWTAPEQLRNTADTERTQSGDIYSYGIILQEIVLREKPYSTSLLGPKGTFVVLQIQQDYSSFVFAVLRRLQTHYYFALFLFRNNPPRQKGTKTTLSTQRSSRQCTRDI